MIDRLRSVRLHCSLPIRHENLKGLNPLKGRYSHCSSLVQQCLNAILSILCGLAEDSAGLSRSLRCLFGVQGLALKWSTVRRYTRLWVRRFSASRYNGTAQVVAASKTCNWNFPAITRSRGCWTPNRKSKNQLGTLQESSMPPTNAMDLIQEKHGTAAQIG